MAVEEIKAHNEFMQVVSDIRAAVDARDGEAAAAKTVAEKAADDLKKAWAKIDELEAKSNRPVSIVSKSDEEALQHKNMNMQLKQMGLDAIGRKGNYQISGNTTGGYTVDSILADQIIRKQRDYDPIRNYARVVTISGGSPLLVPRITTIQTGGFTSETSARSAGSAAVFEQRTITPHPVYAEVLATYAVLEDSAFDLEALILDEAAKTLAYYEGYNFLNGNGSGVPYGILNDSGVLANYETAGNDVLTADALVKLPFKVKSYYHDGAIFLMKPATMAAAVALKDGTSGTIGGFYFHADPNGPYRYSFNGYPAVMSDSVPTLANTSYSVVFGNLNKGYWIVDVAGSMHIIADPYTTKGWMTYHVEKRVGGNVVDPDAFAVIVTS